MSDSILKLHKDLIDGKTTSVELTKKAIAAAKAFNPTLNAFNTISEEYALAQAKEADEKIKSGKNIHTLTGIPMSIKDVIITKDVETTASSKMLKGYIPQFQSTVAQRLFDKGAVMIGKNNSDPYAFGGSGENSGYGPTKNPVDLSRVPGGSSSGTAASVAASINAYSIGTDTGGSIRQPAALCGVTGLKVTYGRNPRYGLISMASSLDTAGIIANTAQDCAIVAEVMAGKDEMDSTTSSKPVEKYSEMLNEDISGLTIGIPKEYFIEGLDPEIKDTVMKSVEKFKSMGCKIEEISLPHSKYALSVYYLIVPSEISSNMGRYDGIRFGNFDKNAKDLEDYYLNSREILEDEVKRRILIGTFALSKGYSDQYYKKAMAARILIKKDFDEAFKKVDAIITPVTPTVAWKLGSKNSNPLEMYLEDIFTVTANLAGIPGVSLPCGEKVIKPEDNDNSKDYLGNTVTKLPIGMQILGNHFEEAKILRLAHKFQTT